MIIVEKLKHISVCYYWATYSVKLMIQEHYDIPEYENTCFLINTYNIADYYPENIEFVKTHKRIIYYMLEHKEKNQSLNKNTEDIEIFGTLYNTVFFNEWWEMDYNAQQTNCIHELSIPIYYKPMRYTSLIKPVKDIYTTRKTIDFCHIGTIATEHRVDIIKNLEFPYKGISIKFITSCFPLENCIPEMNTSRYILDTLRLDTMATPNQVRIFELLCMGYTVCTEKRSLNMFPGLVYEWETVGDLNAIASRGEYLHPTEAYKELTYTDEAYEKYVNYLIEQQNGI